MEVQSSGSGNAAAPSPVTETPKTDTAAIVAQVRQARAKEASLRGNEALAKVLRNDGKADDKIAATAVAGDEKPAKGKPAKEAPAAEAPAEEEAAQEVEAEPAPDPEKEAAERKAKRARELAELADKGRQKWKEKQALKQRDAETQRLRAEHEARIKELQQERERLAAAAKDPLAFLEQSGVPPEEIAKRVIARGSPQAQIEAVRAELEATRKELAERAEREAQMFKQQQEQAQRMAEQQARARAAQQFVSVATDDKKYPALNTLYGPQEILQKAIEVSNLAREADPNVFYEDSEIADLLEQQAVSRLEKLKERIGVAPKSSESPKADAAQETGQKTRTLVSTMQAESTTDPGAFKKLPKWKQNQILGDQLRALQEKKSARAK